jgi:LAGLIDADG DNA endonuclease family
MPKSVRAKFNILVKARTIPTCSTTLTKLIPNNNCKSIVVYGSNIGSNIGFKLDSNTLNNIFITPFIKQVLIGILLGDGNIRKPYNNGYPQIQYNQGFVHLNHILHIFFILILSPILTHLPSLVQRRDLSFYLHLHTRCLACLIPLYVLFIVNGKKKYSILLVND